MSELIQEFKTFREKYDGKVDGMAEDLEKLSARVSHAEQELSRPAGSGGSAMEGKSLADLIWESEEFQTFVKKESHSKGSRLVMRIPADQWKTSITSVAVGSSTPGILVPERVPGIQTVPVRRVRVRDLIPASPTQNNAVEFVRENVFTNMASPTAETVSKPESGVTFTISSAPVRTIAHWIPASRQVLDDFSDLKNFLNVRLVQKLRDIEDNELLCGDGTGQHLSGLMTDGTAFDTSRTVSGDTRLDTLGRGCSQLEELDYVPDGIILHPKDWRSISLIKDETGGANKGRYLLGSPMNPAAQSLWGVPVAVTTAMPVGRFGVGAFQSCAEIRDRMDATIDISNSHADFFVHNMVAIRCEERLALICFNSTGIVFGSF